MCSCTSTGKKKRLRRQKKSRKNYDPFQFMQRRNLSFLLFSLNLLLVFFVLKKNFRQQHCTVLCVVFIFFLLYFIYFVCAKRRRRQNLGIPLILMYIRKKIIAICLSLSHAKFIYVCFIQRANLKKSL